MVTALTLPTTPTIPATDIRDLTTLIYGLPGIGKTTWAAQAEGALFLATEEGQNHLSVHKVGVPDWATFCEYCNLIGAGGHQFKTIVIDTIDNLYEMCVSHFNQSHNLEYEGDLGYGKGFRLIRRQFRDAIWWLSHLPYGLILISHAQATEVKTPTGASIKYTCTLPDKAKDVIWEMADLFLFAELEEVYDVENGHITGYDRVVRSQPTTIYEAKDRTGRLPETLPLDYELFARYIQNTAMVDIDTDMIADADPAVIEEPISEEAYDPYNHD